MSEPMDWKKYEKEIHTQFQEMYPEAEITHNASLPGRYSKTDRQIDILVQDYAAGEKITIIVDGKYYSENIDVKDVESFLAMMQDVGADKGLLITQKGYSQAAINRAYNDPSRLELDILNFDELREFQGFGAIPYSGKYGVVIPSPFGWIIDASRVEGINATIFQRGLSLEDAQKKKEWMYIKIISKTEQISSLEELLKFQEEYTLSYSLDAKISYQATVKRGDAKTRIRKIVIGSYPTPEYTGFVEFDDFFLLCVLFTSDELKDKNIKKLEYILAKALPIIIDVEGKLRSELAELDDLILATKDNIEIASILITQGKILRAANNLEEADQKFMESISFCQTSYEAIKGRIELAMVTHKDINFLNPIVDIFFELGPSNPTICQDLMEIFYEEKDILIELMTRKLNEFDANPEAQGNIKYHLAIFYKSIGSPIEAKSYFESAKQDFLKSLDESHDVFAAIQYNIDELIREQ
jgi:hypothetical protein